LGASSADFPVSCLHLMASTSFKADSYLEDKRKLMDSVATKHHILRSTYLPYNFRCLPGRIGFVFLFLLLHCFVTTSPTCPCYTCTHVFLFLLSHCFMTTSPTCPCYTCTQAGGGALSMADIMKRMWDQAQLHLQVLIGVFSALFLNLLYTRGDSDCLFGLGFPFAEDLNPAMHNRSFLVHLGVFPLN